MLAVGAGGCSLDIFALSLSLSLSLSLRQMALYSLKYISKSLKTQNNKPTNQVLRIINGLRFLVGFDRNCLKYYNLSLETIEQFLTFFHLNAT